MQSRPKENHTETRVLIAAPAGYDARSACSVLESHGIRHRLCQGIAELCAVAHEGAGAMLLTEDSLTASGLKHLGNLLELQPPWSDVPLILLVGGGDATEAGRASLQALGSGSSVTVLERPLRVVTFVTAVKAALRARRRQYQVRDLLLQREGIMAELRERAIRLEMSQGELLQAKEKIARHAEELEHTVAERTARLRETIAQLEAFSYSISHDMRGPLRAMRQYAQILIEESDGRLDPHARDYLGRIGRAANRLDHLIQDVLTYSRIAKAEIRLERVDLDKLLQEIIEQYPGFQWPKADIRIESPLLPVLGHEAALTQCISNLLGNAVKFVPAEITPAVRVWTEQRQCLIRVWIEDNGIGIAADNQQRIFNIFERVHGLTEYEGTGIGLSIVKKTVERMGGEVGLESELGRGSKFWIQLSQPAGENSNPCYTPSFLSKTAPMTCSS